ncbi:MAG: magnesium/cobalt transporter CorA [Candidatus Muiribacteriota bacterium]
MILKKRKHQLHKIGTPPGSYPKKDFTPINDNSLVINYNPSSIDKKNITEKTDIDNIQLKKHGDSVSWIKAGSVKNAYLINKIGESLNIHPLAIEDIYNTDHVQKVEYFQETLFTIVKIFNWTENNVLENHQLSIFFRPGMIFSIEEVQSDFFNHIVERISENKGIIRKMGADYLLYRILDFVIDSYFPVLEKLGDTIEILEEKIISDTSEKIIREINTLKREVLFLRKNIWQAREIVAKIRRNDHELITQQSTIYFSDIYDHIIHLLDTTDNYREIISGMLEIHLSISSNNMNIVMKVLTLISTIFIPLTFIAGIYGMNFEYMPELSWKYGYFASLGVMAVIVVLMMIFFKKKKWF